LEGLNPEDELSQEELQQLLRELPRIIHELENLQPKEKLAE
jgi:hypothetical protein